MPRRAHVQVRGGAPSVALSTTSSLRYLALPARARLAVALSYEIEILDVEPRSIAVAPDRVTLGPQLGPTIQRLIDEVYAFLAERVVAQTGHNIVLYQNDAIDIEVVVAGQFNGNGTVEPVPAPGGSGRHGGPHGTVHAPR